jgi:hypothetical protein
MKVPDLEVIKEIPGYKVILKAVLKSQIQQLVCFYKRERLKGFFHKLEK